MTTSTSTPTIARRAALLALSALALACSQAGEGTSASGSAGLSTSGGEGESDGSSTATNGASASASVTLTATVSGSASDSDGSESGDACGNGAIDPGEVCDGAALGGQTCVGLGDPYVGGDLGCSPLCTAYDASACELDAAAPALKINELLGKGADAGPYAGLGDLIELYNAGGDVADLGGYRLSDEPDLPDDKTFVFPAGVSLGPGAYLVLAAHDEVMMTGDFPFGISTSNPETISLVDPRGVVVDVVMAEDPLTEVSYCRLPDGGEAWSTCLQTPGAANLDDEAMPGVCGDGAVDRGEACDGDDLGGMTCALLSDTFVGGALACTGACTYDTAGCMSALEVVLNELSSSDLDPIELYNAGAAPLDVSGWILTDDTTEPYDPEADIEELVFPPGTVVPAKGYLVVSKGMGALDHPFGRCRGRRRVCPEGQVMRGRAYGVRGGRAEAEEGGGDQGEGDGPGRRAHRVRLPATTSSSRLASHEPTIRHPRRRRDPGGPLRSRRSRPAPGVTAVGPSLAARRSPRGDEGAARIHTALPPAVDDARVRLRP